MNHDLLVILGFAMRWIFLPAFWLFLIAALWSVGRLWWDLIKREFFHRN